MKRFLFFITLLFSSFLIFSQEIEYRCIEKTYGSTSEYMKAGVKTNGICINPNEKIIFHKGSPFNLSGEVQSGYRYYDDIPVFYADCYNGEKYYFNLDAFEVVGSDKLSGIKYDESYEYKKQSVKMIASYYFDILKKNDISAIYEYEPFWKEEEYISPDEHFSDHYSAHRYFVISNTYISSNKKDCRPNSKEIYRVGLNYGALIKEIKKINENLYTIKVFCREDRFDSSTNFIDEFVDLYKNDENTFYLEYDGDYVKIALNEKSNIIGTYVIITSDTKEHINKQLNDIACGYKADLSNIPWPRHADGKCDYETIGKESEVQNNDVIFVIDITPSQIMSVTENLKLRSGEATTTQVLTTMGTGTKVKIIELGHSETIDGITSNWVKVELLAGAIDRDGNPIENGTTGWCYGGYLEEVEEVLSDNQPNQKPGLVVKQSSNLMLIAIIISAVVLVLIIAIIVLVKKRKKNK